MPNDGERQRLRENILAGESPGVLAVIEEMLNMWRHTLHRWHGSVLDALQAGDIPLDSLEGARFAIEETMNPYRAEFITTVQGMWQDGANAGRATAVRRHDLDVSFNISDEATRSALREFGTRAARIITRRMIGDLAEVLVETHDREFSIDAITRELQDRVFPQASGYEARRIARTETLAASNKGKATAYEDAPSVAGKEWLAADDERTRPTHVEADGQTVPLGEEFTVGGHSADLPGDMSLPPEERINCRCTTVPTFDT